MNDLVRKVIDSAAVVVITSPNSDQVSQIISRSDDGKVTAYGLVTPAGTVDSYAGRRTEIQASDKALVVVHRNAGHGDGIFFGALRFDRLEVRVGGECIFELTVQIDARTSPFDPVYFFSEDGRVIGSGRGSKLDLYIADCLLGSNYGGSGSYVSPEVIDWVRSKVQSQN